MDLMGYPAFRCALRGCCSRKRVVRASAPARTQDHITRTGRILPANFTMLVALRILSCCGVGFRTAFRASKRSGGFDRAHALEGSWASDFNTDGILPFHEASPAF